MDRCRTGRALMPLRPPHRRRTRVRLRPRVAHRQTRQGPRRSRHERLDGREHEGRLEDRVPLISKDWKPAMRRILVTGSVRGAFFQSLESVVREARGMRVIGRKYNGPRVAQWPIVFAENEPMTVYRRELDRRRTYWQPGSFNLDRVMEAVTTGARKN